MPRRCQRPKRRLTTTTDPSRISDADAVAAAGNAAAEDTGAEDAVLDEPETGPLRRCLATRERRPKGEMIRFVIGPDRALVADLAGRLPGRGMWLSARADVIETARTRGLFARAARAPVVVPPDLLARLRAGLEERIVSHLGLARRAGQAVAGFDKAGEFLAAGRAGLIVQAADGSADECRRFLGDRGAGDQDGGGRVVRVVRPLSAEAIGAVFGRARTVHVALAHGRLADALAETAAKLAGLADVSAGSAAAQAAMKSAGGDAGHRGPARAGGEQAGAARDGVSAGTARDFGSAGAARQAG